MVGSTIRVSTWRVTCGVAGRRRCRDDLRRVARQVPRPSILGLSVHRGVLPGRSPAWFWAIGDDPCRRYWRDSGERLRVTGNQGLGPDHLGRWRRYRGGSPGRDTLAVMPLPSVVVAYAAFMTGRSARQRRAATIRRIQMLAGVDRSLAEHLVDRQVEPQRLAHALREQGRDVDVALVNVSASTSGFQVTCVGCGTTGRLPFELPAGKVLMCPDCQRGKT